MTRLPRCARQQRRPGQSSQHCQTPLLPMMPRLLAGLTSPQPAVAGLLPSSAAPRGPLVAAAHSRMAGEVAGLQQHTHACSPCLHQLLVHRSARACVVVCFHTTLPCHTHCVVCWRLFHRMCCRKQPAPPRFVRPKPLPGTERDFGVLVFAPPPPPPAPEPEPEPEPEAADTSQAHGADQSPVVRQLQFEGDAR
jgi:hypothetical protein